MEAAQLQGSATATRERPPPTAAARPRSHCSAPMRLWGGRLASTGCRGRPCRQRRCGTPVRRGRRPVVGRGSTRSGLPSTSTSPLICQRPTGASTGNRRPGGRTSKPLVSCTPCSTRPSSVSRATMRNSYGGTGAPSARSGPSAMWSEPTTGSEKVPSRWMNHSFSLSTEEAAQRAASLRTRVPAGSLGAPRRSLPGPRRPQRLRTGSCSRAGRTWS